MKFLIRQTGLAYQSKSINPKDPFNKTERKAVSVTYEQELTPENLEQLYSMCSNPADQKSIFLVIKNEGTERSSKSSGGRGLV